MKKRLCYLLVLLLVPFIGIVNVKAMSITLSTESISANGGTFKVTFSDMTGNSGYTYTKTGDDIANLDTGSNNSCGSGSHINDSISNCSIDYKIKKHNLSNDSNIVFKLKDEASGEEISKTLVIKANQTATTTAAPTTTTNQTKSNNANLKSLTIKTSSDEDVEISPIFNASVYSYDATVDGSIKTVNINTTMEDSKANVVITGADKELKAGENNRITITVTAEDGTKKQYVVNIKREALTADATLKELTIKEVSSFKLEDGKYKYTVKIPNKVESLTLTILTNDEKATYQIEGNKNLKDGSKVKVIVTAEDGTKKEYVLTISKKTTKTKKVVNVDAEKNPLVIMLLSIIAFGLIGGIIYTIKNKNN